MRIQHKWINADGHWQQYGRFLDVLEKIRYDIYIKWRHTPMLNCPFSDAYLQAWVEEMTDY